MRTAIGKEEIEKFNNTNNGKFCPSVQEERIDFKLINRLILDIQNRDLLVNFPTALVTLITHYDRSWIVKITV